MNKKVLVSIAAVLIVAGGAALVLLNKSTPSDKNSSAGKQPKAQPALVTTAAMQATENAYKAYAGDDYDRYYMATMIGHHQSAVEMAKLALTNAKHAELKTVANDIISAQNEEISKMTGWQQAWGYPASTGQNMTDHSAMAMQEEMAPKIEELKKLTGDAFDKRFLSMMIEHHESAIAMSRPAATNAKHQEVKDLAAAVISTQTTEALNMQQWQKDWGYETGSSNSSSNSSSSDMSGMKM